MYCRYEDFPVVCLNRERYLPWQRAQQLENDGLDACSVLIKHHFILVICKYHTFSLVGTFSRSCATFIVLHRCQNCKNSFDKFLSSGCIDNPCSNPARRRGLGQAGCSDWLLDSNLNLNLTTLHTCAAYDPSVSQSVFTITEKAPTRASCLKVPTSN